MDFAIAQKIGPKRQKTIHGFLLCLAVPIARTGEQIYGPGQTPVETGEDGMVLIQRTTEEVFRKETLDSFNGAPFVVAFHNGELDHPKAPDGELLDVDPDNWKQYTAGFFFNVRRGEGHESDLMLADLLVTDAVAIGILERDEASEVSAGYAAKYSQIRPGLGYQREIRGNHVALVPSGRCGWRCSVQDKVSTQPLGVKMKPSLLDQIKQLISSAPADESTTTGDAAANKDLQIHVHTGDSAGSASTPAELITAAVTAALAPVVTRLDALEASRVSDKKAVDKKAADKKKMGDSKEEDEDDVAGDKEEEGDKEGNAGDSDDEDEDEDEDDPDDKKTGDSACFGNRFQSVISGAEILVPGIKFPTFDSKAPAKKTSDSLDRFRRKALTKFNATDEGAEILTGLRGGRRLTGDRLTKLTGDAAALLFDSAVFAVKAQKKEAGNGSVDVLVGGLIPGKRSIADVNKANEEFWKGR